ncbi:MAG TPA: MXAN_5187 C-terminal domain-containing protein [Vicinamibacteria bacterium]|nr:MXAN_5187 C-terminal domain-containing protein [Vicinamibacteria bacterium]
MAISDDLGDLEQGIRKLQVEWEKFFGGVERRPPNDLKTRVENLIRRYAGTEMRNATERFRYQTLTARYNTFSELWNKRLRALEEGRPVGYHGRYERLHDKHAAEVGPPRDEDLPELELPSAPPPRRGEVRVESPELDREAVRELFERFQEARRTTGEKGAVKFESFEKLISQQTVRILTEKGAQAVDFRLETKDGKVSLKARVVK